MTSPMGRGAPGGGVMSMMGVWCGVGVYRKVYWKAGGVPSHQVLTQFVTRHSDVLVKHQSPARLVAPLGQGL